MRPRLRNLRHLWRQAIGRQSMPGLDWFRLYHEARTDAKLKTLTSEQFRVWFNLLCYASETREWEHVERGSFRAEDALLLAVEVANGDTNLLDSTITQLASLRILKEEHSNTQERTVVYTFVAFKRRQWDKPSSLPEAVRERVARSRALNGASNTTQVLPVTRSNALVTPCNAIDTDTDTESEENPPLTPTPPSEHLQTTTTVVRATTSSPLQEVLPTFSPPLTPSTTIRQGIARATRTPGARRARTPKAPSTTVLAKACLEELAGASLPAQELWAGLDTIFGPLTGTRNTPSAQRQRIAQCERAAKARIALADIHTFLTQTGYTPDGRGYGEREVLDAMIAARNRTIVNGMVPVRSNGRTSTTEAVQELDALHHTYFGEGGATNGQPRRLPRPT